MTTLNVQAFDKSRIISIAPGELVNVKGAIFHVIELDASKRYFKLVPASENQVNGYIKAHGHAPREAHLPTATEGNETEKTKSPDLGDKPDSPEEPTLEPESGTKSEATKAGPSHSDSPSPSIN